MKKINKMLVMGLVSLFAVGCAFKPSGMISKINENTYSTTTYGADAATAAKIAAADAKGICKDKHKTEYFKIISQEDKDLSKDSKGGVAGAVGAWIGQNKQNNQTILTFQCN